jgi:hypothetical protein
LFALKAAQGAELVTLDRVNARRPAFAAADMQTPGVQLDLVPLQIADLGSLDANHRKFLSCAHPALSDRQRD